MICKGMVLSGKLSVVLLSLKKFLCGVKVEMSSSRL